MVDSKICDLIVYAVAFIVAISCVAISQDKDFNITHREENFQMVFLSAYSKGVHFGVLADAFGGFPQKCRVITQLEDFNENIFSVKCGGDANITTYLFEACLLKPGMLMRGCSTIFDIRYIIHNLQEKGFQFSSELVVAVEHDIVKPLGMFMVAHGKFGTREQCYSRFKTVERGYHEGYEQLGSCEEMFKWIKEWTEALTKFNVQFQDDTFNTKEE
jgi:hypothetical protein